MRKILALLGVASCAVTAQATVHTVSNRPGSPAQYTSLQAALDAAAAGDSIYVTNSPTSYGTVTVKRSATMIGGGWYGVDSDATLDGLSFGIDEDCSGSAFIGMHINSFYAYDAYVTGTGGNVADLSISRCLLESFSQGVESDGLVINSSVVRGGLQLVPTSTNVVISNNLIGGSISGGGTPSVLISNNVFVVYSGGFALYSLSYAVVSNNIFYGQAPSYDGSSVENCAFNNNLSFSTSDDDLPPTGNNNAGSGNMVGVDPQFVNAPDFALNLAYDYHLQAGSPGHNGGTDGTDIGIYGGGNPVTTLDGRSRLPLVTVFDILNSTLGEGGSLNVQVQGRKND